MKYTIKSVPTLAATLLTFGSLAGGANGAVTVTFQQVNTSVVVTYTGSLDTSGYTVAAYSFSYSQQQITDNNRFSFLSGSNSLWEFNRGSQATGLFTTIVLLSASSFSGSQFGILNSPSDFGFYAPANYTGGTISGSATFDNLDLNSLGVIQQTISFGSSPAQDIIISVIPEPSSTLLLGVGALGLVAYRRRTC